MALSFWPTKRCFGWEQQSNDEMMRDKSLREWNGRVRTTLERVDF